MIKVSHKYSYDSQKLLGKGTTGNVYQGKQTESQKSVAIKVVKMESMNEIQKGLLRNEIVSLKILNCSPSRGNCPQYFIKMLDIIETADSNEKEPIVYIVSELYEGGTLKEYLYQNGRMKESKALSFFRKLVSGYCDINEKDILHRDLKPANVMLDRDQQNPAIIDFGFSQHIVTNRQVTVFNVGSPSYMSPEAYSKTLYSEKSDIWSLGAIFYEILTNLTLDEFKKSKEYFDGLLRGGQEGGYPKIDFKLFSPICCQILRGCLAINPQDRMTVHKVKFLLDKEVLAKQYAQKNKENLIQVRQQTQRKMNFISHQLQENKGKVQKLSTLLDQAEFIKKKANLCFEQKEKEKSARYQPENENHHSSISVNAQRNKKSQPNREPQHVFRADQQKNSKQIRGSHEYTQVGFPYNQTSAISSKNIPIRFQSNQSLRRLELAKSNGFVKQKINPAGNFNKFNSQPRSQEGVQFKKAKTSDNFYTPRQKDTLSHTQSRKFYAQSQNAPIYSQNNISRSTTAQNSDQPFQLQNKSNQGQLQKVPIKAAKSDNFGNKIVISQNNFCQKQSRNNGGRIQQHRRHLSSNEVSQSSNILPQSDNKGYFGIQGPKNINFQKYSSRITHLPFENQNMNSCMSFKKSHQHPKGWTPNQNSQRTSIKITNWQQTKIIPQTIIATGQQESGRIKSKVLSINNYRQFL